ncbi:hypothetical protein L6164_016545 [Bauhinia variegata]|uniref:Uncharacterized protein n=1 Tax=Bauhinia variegata TaxID=167791 RepID=A0ACB9NQE4_BAUVA|nr:hypothetical protein L6164_016545 [Bauhinia variegata]
MLQKFLRLMEKGPGFSSMDGYGQEETYLGHNLPNHLLSPDQGAFEANIGYKIIYGRQEAAFGISGGESESLEESGPHLGISQFFPSDSEIANQPEQLPEGLGQNLDVAYPYGQPAARGSTPTNDYLLQNPLGTVIDELPSPTPPSPLSFPLTPYPTWNPEEPSAASGLVAPQEIQFPEVVGQPCGESSHVLPYQSFEQMGMNPQQEESTPSAELQLGTWNDPPPPQRPVPNSFYDPKYEEMGLPVDPHLRMFLAKHGQDDVLLFAKANQDSFNSINRVWHSFTEANGLNVNLNKSKLWFSPHTSEDSARNLASIFNYNFIVDKVKQRLASWKASLPSFVGRETLIKAVSSAIPAYHMQCVSLPEKICKDLDNINKNFY